MPRPLSNKRRYRAINLGEAVARSFLDDYAAKGRGYFPQGLESLPDIAARIARVQLPVQTAGKVTAEERELAAEHARQDVQRALDVALRFLQEKMSPVATVTPEGM
jgi:hypothetical protein